MVKVERTFPGPVSLEIESKKASGSYLCPDVIKMLKRDFHNKCYICELKDLQDPEVEHLMPHKNGKYPERKFDWNNLFWACGHCNKVKSQQKYDVGILDCCRQDPESVIYFRMQGEEITVMAKDKKNEIAVRTAMLVKEVFNIKNTGMRIYKSAMRVQELNREMNILYDNLEEMKRNPTSGTVKRKLQAILRRESEFAAFKRCYIREHKEQYPQLMQYISDQV